MLAEQVGGRTPTLEGFDWSRRAPASPSWWDDNRGCSVGCYFAFSVNPQRAGNAPAVESGSVFASLH